MTTKFYSILFTLFFIFNCMNGISQIKVWSNNNVTVGYNLTAPSEAFHITGNSYQISKNSTSGWHFENYKYSDSTNFTFNEPMLRPQDQMSMWVGNTSNQMYRVYSRRLYHSDGVWLFSDSKTKESIVKFNENATNLLSQISAYRYNLIPNAFGELDEDKRKQLESDSKNKIGLIAQEVKVVFPELVSSDEENLGIIAVNYSGLIPVLIEAIKEQNERIIKLEKEIEELKK